MIGKKHIVLTALVFALGIAIYLNWSFTDSGEGLDVTTGLDGTSASDVDAAASGTDDTDNKNYGDADFVGNSTDTSADSDSYFAQARLSKEQARDDSIETFASLMEDSGLSDAEQIAEHAQTLASYSEKEDRIESLVTAKGFEDCVAYIDGENANVIVKSKGLLPSEVAQIKDVIVSVADVKAENISIVEVE